MAKRTTGRFKTRAELIDRICRLRMEGDMSIEAIGKSVGVSQTTVAHIYDGDEGKAYREALASHIEQKGMDAVNDLVENPPDRQALEKIEHGGDTYQVDLMAHSPEMQRFEIAKRISRTLAASNLVPEAYRGRPNDVFVAINMGHELGMGEFQAIQSIAVIEGKPCLYGDGLIGVVRSSPKCVWIKETLSSDEKIATCETQRLNEPHTISATYSMDDAVQAGIHMKFNWKKHPKRMLQMRARAYCLRDAYPDILKGLGVVEEMQDHEDTPPPITQYALPEPAPSHPAGSAFDTKPVTLSEVEHAMHQSETMGQLLAAGQLAKGLTNNIQISTAKITYKKMRTALMSDTTPHEGEPL